jgi:hypothetical protein
MKAPANGAVFSYLAHALDLWGVKTQSEHRDSAFAGGTQAERKSDIPQVRRRSRERVGAGSRSFLFCLRVGAWAEGG